MIRLSELTPRDTAVARKSAISMTALAGALTGISAVIVPVPSPSGVLSVVVTYLVPAALMLSAAILTLVRPRWRALACFLVPAVGVVEVMALDLATRDASAAAQVFLCYPILYAASQLRPAGAWVVLAIAAAADAIVALSSEANGRALNDIVYVTATLFVMTALLTRAGQRQDDLFRRLSDRASIDPLTGLATRRAFDEAATAALSGGAAGEDGIALILIDLDRFKVINDTYGHPVGDDALVHVARTIAAYARADAVIGRVGGDELAVLLAGCSKDVAADRAQTFARAVRQSPFALPDGTAVSITVSIGVAHVGPHYVALRDVYARADAALYEAKRGGRDQVSLAATSPIGDPAR